MFLQLGDNLYEAHVCANWFLEEKQIEKDPIKKYGRDVQISQYIIMLNLFIFYKDHVDESLNESSLFSIFIVITFNLYRNDVDSAFVFILSESTCIHKFMLTAHMKELVK